jgi:hypothetical protein
MAAMELYRESLIAATAAPRKQGSTEAGFH